MDTKQINDCADKRDGHKNSVLKWFKKNTITSLTLLGDNSYVGVDISTEQINDCDDNTDANNMLKCNNILPLNRYKDNKYKKRIQLFCSFFFPRRKCAIPRNVIWKIIAITTDKEIPSIPNRLPRTIISTNCVTW